MRGSTPSMEWYVLGLERALRRWSRPGSSNASVAGTGSKKPRSAAPLAVSAADDRVGPQAAVTTPPLAPAPAPRSLAAWLNTFGASWQPAPSKPVTVETIVVPDPGPGEALVQVQACGVCHTDLHYREGGISDDFPFLLGHEAAGVVEAVGDGRHRRRARRLRRPQLARGVRRVPGVPPRPAVVLLRDPQRARRR